MILATTATGEELPRPVECPPAKQKEVSDMNLEFQKQGALAQVMAMQCDAQGEIVALTLVRLRDGQLMQWRPAEGRAVLARKLSTGE